MTAVQTIFVLLLAGVLVSVGATAVLIVRSATRVDGGAYPSRALVARMLRSPEDRAELNRWAWYLHRITGIAVFGFLCLHILDVGAYTVSHGLYDDLHRVYGSWPMRIFESLLLGAILFHTFNGLRILAIDLADLGPVAARRALGGVAGLTLVLTVAGAVVILSPVFS
jgi:succinate dehydrogenase / fumarate reductase cytochrome b subunit